MSRLFFVHAAAAAVVACTVTSAADAPLNVVLVMTDDQGYPDLACHGNPVIQTPNMDRLAAASVQFSDFHVNPFCSPTRAALMTGRMSDRTGVTSTNDHRNYLRRDEVLMPEYFRASGYRTGIFGKWHVGANYPYRPIDRGFDEWLGLGNNGLATMADPWNNDRMNDTYWHNGQLEHRNGFCTDVYFDAAMSFIKDSKQAGKPFFTYLATNVPHWDWNVPADWLEPYLATCSRERAAFYASINRVDRNLGRLMSFLDAEGLSDSTLLVFLTDNGSDVPDKPNAYTAGMRGFKGSRYEGGHRVPCFVRGPESVVGQPRVVDELTAHLDLLPTFIDVCGLRAPSRPTPTFDGRSLAPLLTGDGKWPDRTIVMHHHNGKKPEKHLRALVMTSEWRLIKPKEGRRELYRIKEDRSQKHDVASQRPGVVAELEAAYSTHWDALGLDRPLERPRLSSIATLRLSGDITRGHNPITQQAVRQGKPIDAVWLLDVEEPGRYGFDVRRWPREANTAMQAGLPPNTDAGIEYIGHDSYRIDVPGAALDVASVELRLSGREPLSMRVGRDSQGVTFEVDLDAGPVDVEASLVLRDGSRQGAYFVYAEKATP